MTLIVKLIKTHYTNLEKNRKRNIISDKLVVGKTGKDLEHWYKLLDNKGALKMKHPDIFKVVQGMEGLKQLGLWNQNLLTTSYEWDRGLKKRGEREKDFEIGVSRTFNISVSLLYRFFSEEKNSKKWSGEKFKIRKSTTNKSLVLSWKNDTTVRIDFYLKAAAMKKFWTASMNNLKAALA